MRILLSLLILFFAKGCIYVNAQSTANHSVKGKVIDKITREPIPFASIQIASQPNIGAISDTLGAFQIDNVPPGIFQLIASCIGYKKIITPEYILSTHNLFIEIVMTEDISTLNEVTIQSTAISRAKEAPIGLQVIGLREIEKSPGGNRDISRIIRSYPGVAFSPVGYRNDLIVRGGAPFENRYFIDGIEIPNINHFSTQGASGGPVSILNADLIREVQFYTSSFPVNRSGALSSVMDIRLRDGNKDGNSFKGSVGASEFAFSGNGHFSDDATYLFSIRQSYLQYLFKFLGLPFLPNYIDGQFKIKYKPTPKDEIIVLGLTGIDNMTLNTEQEGDLAAYILSYLPTIKQQTFTIGSTYRHYAGKSVRSISIGYNYLRNNNLKYFENDDSKEEKLILRLNSIEQNVSLRAENTTFLKQWTFLEGVEVHYAHYYNNTRQKISNTESAYYDYLSTLGLIRWSGYGSAKYLTTNERFSTTAAIRFDGCNYSTNMAKFYKHLSPRLAASYNIYPTLSINASTGINQQLPPYTSLGFKNPEGKYVNKNLKYMQVFENSLGLKWSGESRLILTLEGFFKYYYDSPLSLIDSIPLACKGNDYGIVGAEPLSSTASGRAYGLEGTIRWFIPDKMNLISSFTLYQSEYRNSKQSPYLPSAWDNRFILNLSGTYNLKRNWDIGCKLSYIGGPPYTPFDYDLSSSVLAWNATGRPALDYALYNTERLPSYFQLDVRVDKVFYLKNWMFGFYIDLQNITLSKLKEQDIILSTGIIENPQAPLAEQKYLMKTIERKSGALVPTLGIMFEF